MSAYIIAKVTEYVNVIPVRIPDDPSVIPKRMLRSGFDELLSDTIPNLNTVLSRSIDNVSQCWLSDYH